MLAHVTNKNGRIPEISGGQKGERWRRQWSRGRRAISKRLRGKNQCCTGALRFGVFLHTGLRHGAKALSRLKRRSNIRRSLINMAPASIPRASRHAEPVVRFLFSRVIICPSTTTTKPSWMCGWSESGRNCKAAAGKCGLCGQTIPRGR